MAKNLTAMNVRPIRPESTSVATVSEHHQALIRGFDYTKLDTTTAEFLQGAAALIRSSKESWGHAIIRIGMTLRGAKAHLEHGQFGAWLNTEFGWSERTAQNYMALANVFKTKSEIIADLPPTFAYKLVAPSTPEIIQNQVIADLEAGKSINFGAVLKAIKESRGLARCPSAIGRSEGGKISNADTAECTDRVRETEAGEKARLQEDDDSREVITILAKLTKADLARLGALLSKPQAWELFKEALAIAAGQASEADDCPELPSFLDRRRGRVPQPEIN